MRTFDRIARFDERSRGYRARTLTPVNTPRSYTWRAPDVLDQDKEGACVGFAWAHEALAYPRRHLVDETFARDVYRRARAIDDIPDSLGEGTSVLAGAKVMVEAGVIRSYRWAFDIRETLVAISRYGPAVLGLDWYEGMYEPDARGFIKPQGAILGGHAILAIGVSIPRQSVTVLNSWGRSWGAQGRAELSWPDLRVLLRARGEVCVPVVRG